MIVASDYVKEFQKFTTSQYWNSGLRITAGVLVPLIVIVMMGQLSAAVPFLWGALFVSLTDTPGPIHHRRNGMIAAIVVNTCVVLLTSFSRNYPGLLITEVVVLAFLLSMSGVYGNRAGAVGTLAIIVMLLNLLSIHTDYSGSTGGILIGFGGLWYMLFSLLLYRIRPYRAVEQSLGEHLIALADYVRARGSFYKEGANLETCFTTVMKAQSAVQELQNQTQSLLFKTRRLLGDASPKSRSLMMIYLDSIDLFEQTMYSYQDYESLHKTLDHTGLPNRFYGLILELAAGIEHVGLSVQRGTPVKKGLDITIRIDGLHQLTLQHRQHADHIVIASLDGLEKILSNVQDIGSRINKLVLYTRLEVKKGTTVQRSENVIRAVASQPLEWKILQENLTFKSDIFRHALRLTVAILIAYVVSVLLSLNHSYWVLLTIITILKPAYAISRKRNISRLVGTLVGVIAVSLILYFTQNTTVLLSILIMSMLLGYSLLRMHYFGFVVFLTIFVVISFYFLNPHGFQPIIRERLVDTFIGSIIAFLASRFIFPVWTHGEINDLMQKMVEANRHYFLQAWIAMKNRRTQTPAYAHARQDAIVSLTNLSDNFQRMLDEPRQTDQATPIHQFVIASHMMTGHIAALSTEEIGTEDDPQVLEAMARSITSELQCAADLLQRTETTADGNSRPELSSVKQPLAQLSMIFGIAKDLRKISSRLTAGS